MDGKKMSYVSRRYLKEKWDDLKWDMEKIVGVYEEGPDNVEEEVIRVKEEMIYFIDAIKKEISK